MSLKICIVDDDSTICSLHSAFLDFIGVKNQVEIFRNGKLAMSYLDKDAADQDNRYLLLMDIEMPVLDGWAFLDELQNRNYHDQCFVAMVSSSIDKKVKAKARSYSQVVGYFVKPLNILKVEALLSLDGLKNYVVK